MKPSTEQDYHERIVRTLAYIQRHLDDELELENLAAVAAFSRFHFHRVFRGLVGESLQEHIRRLRLERAAQRLKQGDGPIIGIAFEAGFETHESFTRAFGTMFGVPPSGYRAAHKSAPESASGTHLDDVSGYHPPNYEAPLAVELEERERNTIARRIKEAHLPRIKTLEEFDFSKAPQVSATEIQELAQGGYIERAEPVIFIGDCGTGKTHLLTGLCVAACRQKRRVRFATAAALVNELVEAKQQLQLQRVLARWERYDLIAIDEVGYVPMADLGAEFLFQVIAGRAEKAAVILTTNLPFSEWTQVIPNARLCKALLDRITDRAHIIETGTDSYRFRRTVEKGRSKKTG